MERYETRADQWRRIKAFLPGRAYWVGVTAKGKRDLANGMLRELRTALNGRASPYCPRAPDGPEPQRLCHPVVRMCGPPPGNAKSPLNRHRGHAGGDCAKLSGCTKQAPGILHRPSYTGNILQQSPI